MIRWFTILIFLLLDCTILFAQSESNDYGRVGQSVLGTTTATDYQAIGVNPANLGFIPEVIEFKESNPNDAGVYRRKRIWSISLGESSAAIHSDAMNRSNLLDAVFSFNSTTFSIREKREAARLFTNNGVFLNADITLLGFSYQTENYGGVAFSVRDRVSGEFSFNYNASQLAFLGRNSSYFDSSYYVPWNNQIVGVSTNPKLFSQLFDSTRISMSWTREFNAGYGRRIFKGKQNSLYAGFTVRYIQGFAYLNSYIDENKELIAYSAITPLFDINYGKATTPSKIDGNGMTPVGRGMGFDIGFTYTVGYRWRVGVSLLDVGRIVWNGNVYRAQDTILNGMSSTGFNNYNLFTEAQKITGDGGYFKWGGLNEVTSILPARVRFGATYTLGTFREVGLDVLVPLTTLTPANISGVLVSAGCNYQIYPWMHVSGGLTLGGTMGTNFPIGVMFSLFDGFWEFGVSSRDIITYLVAKDPTLSLNVGLCRLRF